MKQLRNTINYRSKMNQTNVSRKGLPDGKLPISVLEKMLSSLKRGNLLVAPKVGIDVGVWKSRGKYIVSSSDPITGTGNKIGWHAVNVSVNDVATSGITPEVLNIVAIFPVGSSTRTIQRTIGEISKTATDLGISVAGGHTEITPGLSRPILTVTAIGSGNRFVTAAEATAYDVILMTKTAGIEGTAILSKLPRVKAIVGRGLSRRGASLIKNLSILKEARLAFRTGKIHAMHDITEGGVLGAVYEMSLASRLGFVLDGDTIPIDQSTEKISAKLGIDPLRLIGSGALILACSKKSKRVVLDKLRSNDVRCSEIGTFLPRTQGRKLKRRNSFYNIRESDIQDELWSVLDKYGNFS